MQNIFQYNLFFAKYFPVKMTLLLSSKTSNEASIAKYFPVYLEKTVKYFPVYV